MSMERKEQLAIFRSEFKQVGQEWQSVLDYIAPEVTSGFDTGNIKSAISWIDRVLRDTHQTKDELLDLQKRLHEFKEDGK